MHVALQEEFPMAKQAKTARFHEGLRLLCSKLPERLSPQLSLHRARGKKATVAIYKVLMRSGLKSKYQHRSGNFVTKQVKKDACTVSFVVYVIFL